MVTPGSWLITRRRAFVDRGSVVAALVTVLVVCTLVSGVVAALPALQQQALRAAMRQLPADDVAVEVTTPYHPEDAARQDQAVRTALQPLVASTRGVVIRQLETVAHTQVPAGGQWTFTALTGGDEVVQAVDGRLPSPSAGSALEVAVPATNPAAPDVGDRLTLTSPLDGRRVKAVVVGSWRPGRDARRSIGRPSGSALLVDTGSFDELAVRAASTRWRAAPTIDRLRPEQLDGLTATAGGIDHEVAALEEELGTTMQVQNPLGSVLEARARELAAQRMLLLVPALMLLLVGAAAAMLVANALSENRIGDDALRRARGADRRRVIAPTVLEAAVVCALGAVGGPIVAAAVVRIGAVRPTLGPGAWTAGAAAAAVCWAALVVPAAVRTFGGDRGEQFSVERRRRRVLTSLLTGGLLTIALGLVAALRLESFSSAVAETSHWSAGPDPLLVASPALLLLSLVTVFAMVLLPALLRLSERAVRTRGLALALGTRSAARAPAKAVPLALAVALAAGGLSFASVERASQQDARNARAAYEVGADLRVTPAPGSRRTGVAEDRELLRGIAGVEDVAGVHRELDFVDDVPAEILVADLGGAVGRQLVATAGDPAGTIARLRSASSGTPGAVPVVVTQDLADDAALKAGDQIQLTLGDEPSTLQVAEVLSALPTVSDGRAGVLMDAESLRSHVPTASDSTAPGEWWLAVDDSRVAEVASALRERPRFTDGVLTREQALRRLAADPGTGGAPLTDVMTVTAMGSLLIGVVLLCSVVVLRRRERDQQATFLRALGTDERDVTMVLATEYTVTTGGGVITGACAGVLTAAVALHATSLGSGGRPLVPAPELHLPWAWTLTLLVVLLLVPMVALHALTRLGDRRGVASRLDLRRHP